MNNNNHMNYGFVKINRSILDDPIFKNHRLFLLYCYLLLRANFKETEIIWNGENLKIPIGSFVTGRLEMSKATNLKQTTIEDYLTYLEKATTIRQQKTNKWRMITVLNQDEIKKTDSKPTTNRQQSDTDKKDKKEKKINNINAEGANKLKNCQEEDGNGLGEPLLRNEEKKFNKDDLLKQFDMNKKIKINTQWQAEATEAYKFFNEEKDKIDSFFKKWKENLYIARNAYNDCKELGKRDLLYFFKVYSDLRAKNNLPKV